MDKVVLLHVVLAICTTTTAAHPMAAELAAELTTFMVGKVVQKLTFHEECLSNLNDYKTCATCMELMNAYGKINGYLLQKN